MIYFQEKWDDKWSTDLCKMAGLPRPFGATATEDKTPFENVCEDNRKCVFP
jgi:hypothetical protein